MLLIKLKPNPIFNYNTNNTTDAKIQMTKMASLKDIDFNNTSTLRLRRAIIFILILLI